MILTYQPNVTLNNVTSKSYRIKLPTEKLVEHQLCLVKHNLYSLRYDLAHPDAASLAG